MSSEPSDLPIEAIRGDVARVLDRGGRIVLGAPTGSGKSTQLPRWLLRRGKTLVIEPRRVACSAVGSRVAELEGVSVGAQVGWVVRDEVRAGPATVLTFATPGVALRWWAEDQLARFAYIVIDEVHERSMDVDLLLALLRHAGRSGVIAMSATIDTDRLATWLDAEAITAQGRLFPVDIAHRGVGTLPPSSNQLTQRTTAAVKSALQDPGDVLVFLPGVGEIRDVQARLSGLAGVEVLALHGRLTLSDQRRVFHPGSDQRVILSTNVAETSVTVPRIRCVIDSGLVRRTQYHQGRGFLALRPVARDAADQRAGRAGRLGPGRCIRLWGERATIQPQTPPELLRERLAPLALAAAACGHPDLSALPWLDPPPPYAVADAEEELRVLEALDDDGLSEKGRALFGLPLDPALGRLLIEADVSGQLDAVIRLVSALQTRRTLLRSVPDPDEDPLRSKRCDATACLLAMAQQQGANQTVDAHALREARSTEKRLRRAWGLPREAPGVTSVDRRALALTLLRADPRRAYLPRRRGQQIRWANGGTEVTLARYSVVEATEAEALVVLTSRAVESGHRDRDVIITAAMPVPLAWLREAGLGRLHYIDATLERGKVRARFERRHAGVVLEQVVQAPSGEALHAAIVSLVKANRLFKRHWPLLDKRVADTSLLATLQGEEGLPSAADWLLARLAVLGVQDPEDVALLEPTDLLPAPLHPSDQDRLDRKYPRTLDLSDTTYELSYEPSKKRVRVEKKKGSRNDPPPLSWLPSWPGWRILFVDGNRQIPLRR